MKKQNSRDGSDDPGQLKGKDLERIEKIWEISTKELPDGVLIDLEDFPEVIKKTKASLEVLLEKPESEKNSQIGIEELTGPVLEVFRYMVLGIQMSQLKSGEGCKNMYA